MRLILERRGGGDDGAQYFQWIRAACMWQGMRRAAEVEGRREEGQELEGGREGGSRRSSKRASERAMGASQQAMKRGRASERRKQAREGGWEARLLAGLEDDVDHRRVVRIDGSGQLIRRG